MAANHLENSPLDSRKDHLNLHDRDNGLDRFTPSDHDSDESNTSLMNGGVSSRREEKKVSLFSTVSYIHLYEDEP